MNVDCYSTKWNACRQMNITTPPSPLIEGVKYIPWYVREKQESASIRMSVESAVTLDLGASAPPVYCQMSSECKCFSLLTLHSIQHKIWRSNSISISKRRLEMEWEICLSLLTLASMRTSLDLLIGSSLSRVRLLFPDLRYPWLPASMQ